MQVVIENALFIDSDGGGGYVVLMTNPEGNYVDIEIDSSMFINYAPFHIDFNCSYSTFKAA